MAFDFDLAANDRPREEVQVPEWGTSLWVRTMGADERFAYEQRLREQKNGDGKTDDLTFMVELVMATCEDEAGQKVFGPERADWLRGRNAKVLLRLSDAAGRLNALTEAAREDLAKNSEGSRDSGSGSSSAAPSAAPSAN